MDRCCSSIKRHLAPPKAPLLNSVFLSSQQVSSASASTQQGERTDARANETIVKNNDLKMYHVVSVKAVAKAITEDVRERIGPKAEAWILAILEPTSFKKLGLCEEVSKDSASSIPLPARLILATKPNIQGGPARKKARIVIWHHLWELSRRAPR